MPLITEMLDSKFLKKEDVGDGVILTVSSCEEFNVAKQGAEPELKWALTFGETDKPLIMNSTNTKLCAKIFGSNNTDDWVGQSLIAYADPMVMYAGQVVGGIRVRSAVVVQPKAASIGRRRATAAGPQPVTTSELPPPADKPVSGDKPPF